MITIHETRSASGHLHLVARIVLADGRVAGEGYAATQANAIANAVADAKASPDPRDRTAAAFQQRLIVEPMFPTVRR